MAISKAATISVLVAAALLYFTPVHPGIIFAISGFGVTFVYRAAKGCFNFINPMGVAGSGAVVVVHYFYQDPIAAFVAGLVISVIIGLMVS